MDDARDLDCVILRVITTAGTTVSTPSTAIGFASNNGWRPQKLYITVGTTKRFLSCRLLLLYTLDWLVIFVHSPISTKDNLLTYSLHLSISQQILESRRRSVRGMLEI